MCHNLASPTVKLYRPHRGGLDTAMAEVREFDGTIAGLQDLVEYPILSFQYYCYDDRIKWQTYIVTCVFPDGTHGVAGYTNCPVK